MAKEIKLDEKGFRKFGIRDSIAYAAGDLGCNMSFALKSYLIIFWTQFMGMDNNLYAALLLIVQVWDAINDPLIGSMVDADRRQYKRNKFLQYIWAGSIGLLVAGALCFVPWQGAPAMIKNILFLAGYILWDAFYTVANVPYGSLLSLISDNPGDRASLSAFRSIGAGVGNVIAIVTIPMLIYDASNNIVGSRLFLIALVMGLLGFISFQFMIKNTVIRVNTDITVSEDTPKFNIIKALGNFMKNRPAVGATLAAMGMFIGMQGATAAVQVMFQSYFQDASLQGVVSLFAMMPMLLFTPFARKLVLKFGKKELSAAGALISVAACACLIILPITPDRNGLLIYVACQFVNNMGMGLYSTVSWSLMGDAIDYNEWKNGVREEGTVYSLHSFFRKLAQGMGPSAVLVIMGMLGYVGANGANQGIEVATNMRYLVAYLYLFSAAMQFVGLGLVYNLDKKTTEQMTKELEEKHKALKA